MPPVKGTRSTTVGVSKTVIQPPSASASDASRTRISWISMTADST